MKQKIVVTGMGVISPIGNTVNEFWHSVKTGRSGIGPITRFDCAEIPSKIAAEIKDFDPTNYMDVKEAKRMALFTQYAVAAARMAWEDAGLADVTLDNPQRASIFMGNGIGGIEVHTESHKKLFERGPRKLPPMTIPKVIGNEAAGNISMLLGIKGITHTIVTACASGTDAIGHGLGAIRAGMADIVLAGGCEATITEYAMGGFCVIKALSTGFNDEPTRASRPFDKDRDGFVMGEGAGMLVLEREDHAKARGATILGELAGYGATSDAYHLTAPHPSGDGAADAFRIAMEDAGLTPADVDYINAHGTSTPINDPVETRAIKTAFGAHAQRVKVSSTKALTGHGIGAAGAFEAIISILAMRDGFFPATYNLDEPDEECDLDFVPNEGVTGEVRAALSDSLGFGGHNGVLAFRRAQ